MPGLLVNNMMVSMLALAGPQSAEAPESAVEAAQITAPEQTTATREKLLGRYNLRGVMETASGLELLEDGSFRWFLIVGGLDAFSGGRWRLEDGQLVMVYDPPKEGAGYDALGTVVMQIDGDNLLPPKNFGRGTYVKLKPRAENE